VLPPQLECRMRQWPQAWATSQRVQENIASMQIAAAAAVVAQVAPLLSQRTTKVAQQELRSPRRG